MLPAPSLGERGDRWHVGVLIAERRRGMRMTLQRVADMVQCSKSFLWGVEHGRVGVSEELLERLQRSLGFKEGELVRAARWDATPPDVRAAVARLEREGRAARRLAQILGGGGGGGVKGKRALDEAYRSGELRELVERIDGGKAMGNRQEAIGERGRGKEGGVARMAAALPLEVPVVNRVAAGYPREFTDLGYPARVAAEYVRCVDVGDADAFAARVVGDSMLPEYREGDIVVFSPAREVRSGMDCFARIEPDHESTFKRVYLEAGEGGEMIRLQPLNPAFPARVLKREDVAGLYAAVSVTRVVGGGAGRE